MRQQPAAGETSERSLRVLIVCDHASATFGGEAILPLHYFRVLRNRGHNVWLVSHARTRAELSALFPGEERISYIEDTGVHKLMWQIARRLPARLAYFTVSLVSRLAVQLVQRGVVRRLVASERIDIVHQPTPVSPREPSLMYDLGAPVIVGPMNGGMDFPPAFRPERGWLRNSLVPVGHVAARLLNQMIPGKRQAAMLLVANARTRNALPDDTNPRVEELAENGVELDLWTPRRGADTPGPAWPAVTTFAFVGRLVRLKAVHLLLDAFAIASARSPMRLVIMGDGEERERLTSQVAALFPAASTDEREAPVRFTGWLPQQVCARELERVDCVVMPSLHDCGGAVVLEAMSMYKPVIATAWGGPLDYLDASCGILIKPCDRQGLIDGLADAMTRLADSPQERAALGRAARAKIEAEYDWEVKANHILDLYRRVLAQPVAAGS